MIRLNLYSTVSSLQPSSRKRAQIESAESSKRKCDGAITEGTNPDEKCKNEQTSE